MVKRQTKNGRSDLNLPPDKYRWDDDLGKYRLHESLFVAHQQNPRERLGDERDKLLRLMESIKSGEHGGVHLPVSGYIADNQFHVIEGHRRVFAVRNIIRDMLAGVTDGQPPPDIDRYAYIPVAIEPSDQSKLSILIRMQSSDSLKDEWGFKGRLDHIQHIYEEYQAEKRQRIPIDELPRSLAQSIGWPMDKMHLMIRVSQSPTLRTAIAEYTTCTFKTWREVVKIAKVLVKNRTSMMEQITGLHDADEDALTEATYTFLVEKVRYYVGPKKKGQAGAQLNRCIPALRNDDFPPERIRDWLTNDIDLTSNSYERETEVSKRTEKMRLFVQRFQPNLTEPQLNERINTFDETLAGDMAHPPAPVDDNVSESSVGAREHVSDDREPIKDVDVLSHVRSRPGKPTDEKAISIIIPTKKQKVFEEIVRQVEEMVESDEVSQSLTTMQKKLFDSAFSILDQGRKKRKTA